MKWRLAAGETTKSPADGNGPGQARAVKQNGAVSEVAAKHVGGMHILANTSALLPLRQELLRDGQQLLDFPSRFVVGGPDVLVALARPAPLNDFALLIQRRSLRVSGDQGLVAVVPMGYHQHSINSEVEVALSHTVFREFYEELCGGVEVIKDTARFLPDWFFHQCPSLGWFRDNRGGYELVCTAFGISLGPGNAQFAVTLAVPNERFWTS